jgi:hypothetical protein
MTLHGIELDASGRPAWFRFGMLRLLHALSVPNVRESRQSGLARRWVTVPFLNAVRKFQDTFWKYDRTAGHIEKCSQAIRNWVELEAGGSTEGMTINNSEFNSYLTALEDMPIYLDSMLLYLRIQADAFASVLPYLYARRDVIPSRSFREQRDWFLKAKPNFDPGLARILASETRWFEQLAGKAPSGLRDIIVHRGGTYQLGWTIPSPEDEFQLLASLVNASGFAEQDVVGAIVGMTRGWFGFLDSCCEHFLTSLQPLVSWTDLSRPELSRYVGCKGELPSFWVYPRLLNVRPTTWGVSDTNMGPLGMA